MSMLRGYRLSFVLAGLLAVAAFVEQYAVMRGKRPGLSGLSGSLKDAPVILFLGSLILIVVGWLEYMRQEKKKNKK
jgi:hypothetical protein